MDNPSLLQRIRQFFGIDVSPIKSKQAVQDYQRRLRWIQFGWIVAGIIILALGSSAAAVGIGLFMTFISFALIDDS